MSISIPVLFPSVKYNNNYYLDGGLYDEICLYKIKLKNIKENNMIVITFINKNNKNNNNEECDEIYDLINYVSKCTYTFINENINNNRYILLKDYKYFYCYVNDISNNNMSNFCKLVINEEKKIEMINKGYKYF